MKLGPPEFGNIVQRQRQQSLRMVADEVLNATGRPCPRCVMVCPTCKSTTCDCHCEATCDHAPLNMTSDDEFPIEDKIAPLVYAFHQLHQCPPCWSCEGHLGLNGELQRLPAVWFYAGSQVFAGMIGDYVSSLWIKKKLCTPWRVIVAVTEPGGMEPAYSLEPDLKEDSAVTLPLLQNDIAVIAEGLVDNLQGRTRDLMQQVDEFLSADHT
ncbi:MAG: hypothetical protein HOE62_08125 [Alphaproteobacteria bacterium]|nr:hypothetical protein [Alphaproteobacteria bacterium]MBT4017902.1 hypothetical protein [Alphaproteobacteria bacterium]